jgi:putative solute:sodium symporter small subunit
MALMRSMSMVFDPGARKSWNSRTQHRSREALPVGRTIPAMTNSTPEPDRYWTRNLRLIAILLALWLVVTLGIGLGARSLSFDLFGWPFGFWAAAQGALFVYVGIVAVYAWVMNRRDAAEGSGDPD